MGQEAAPKMCRWVLTNVYDGPCRGVPLYPFYSLLGWRDTCTERGGSVSHLSTYKRTATVDIHAPTAPNLHPHQKIARNAKSQSLSK
ncbi:MAG: hypothetical protein ACI8PB_004276 [Desulforhopalus sp.]